MTEQERQNMLLKIARVFTPSAPITSQNFFAGRIEQIKAVQDAINENGLHAILYGERGVGKTSLANIIREIFQLGKVKTSKVICNKQEDFSSFIKASLGAIYLETTFRKGEIGFGDKKNEIKKQKISLGSFLSEKPTIIEVVELLKETGERYLLLFDEFDTISNEAVKSQFAHFVKALSDDVPNATVLIVGIANSVNGLIGEHPSLTRCLKNIYLPRMNEEELEGIITKGLAEIGGIGIEEETKKDIIKLSQGYPYYTHLFMKNATKVALEVPPLPNINKNCLEKALLIAVKDIDEGIRNKYEAAVISSKKDTLYEPILEAVYLALTKNKSGSVTTKEIVEALNQRTGKNLINQTIRLHLGLFCSPTREHILKKVGKDKNIKYKFSDPLMEAFIGIKIKIKN